MRALFEWVEATRIALTIRDSLPLTAGLSAVHLLGFTLVTGGALLSNLRLLGLVLPNRPAGDVTRTAGRGMAVGLLISVVTGALLFSPRAVAASANGIFQIKMLSLIAAATFQIAILRPVSQRPAVTATALRSTGAVGFVLWTGLALAGAAFILLE